MPKGTACAVAGAFLLTLLRPPGLPGHRRGGILHFIRG